MKKKNRTVVIVLAIILIILGSVVAFSAKEEETPPVNTSQQMVGNDKDEHGCIGSAGYSWCEPKAKCLRLWEENCEESAADQIRYLLSLKYEKPIEDVDVTVTKAVDTYVSGSVRFGPDAAGGGQFLAYQKDGVWMVVYDGNGSIDCPRMRDEYGFPDAILVPNFCD